jgi:hypothetical protein
MVEAELYVPGTNGFPGYGPNQNEYPTADTEPQAQFIAQALPNGLFWPDISDEESGSCTGIQPSGEPSSEWIVRANLVASVEAGCGFPYDEWVLP